VSYSNDVKACALGVPTDALNEYGAVSEPVVRTMAEGAAHRLGAQVSVATSGIAGPGGGSLEKPVGTVWIATHVNGVTTAHVHHFNGNRAAIMARAAKTALISILRAL
jgi:PncC family amidohydrolase